MKKFLLLLLLLPLVSAQPAEWFQSSFVKVQLNVSSSVDLLPRGPQPFVESLTADVIFVPHNSEFVAVRSFDSVPSALVTADRVRFEWVAPALGSLNYRYSAVVETVNSVPRVRAKIPYPIAVPNNLKKYIEPTKNIDSNNPAVLGQAHLIVKNEDDLFLVVSKLAVWVKSNVDYNLSTLTAEVSQPASWVLENRYGVCDELTSLFIAMLRALKIPARFVSGVAFSSSPDVPGGWGAHGWAEVYFPGVGWVPFDPTFGEYGWVDPGHIKLKESFDPQEPTTVFEWQARDVDVKVQDLEVSAGLVEKSGRVPPELKIAVSPLKARVGFGSYNGIVLDVENLADYYVGADFSLTRVTDMKILGSESQGVVLTPRGRGRVFWTVEVKEGLDPKFQYELPLLVYSIRNETFSSAFAVGQWDVGYSLLDINSNIERLTVSQKDALDLACAFENDLVWTDAGKLNCLVQNRAEVEVPVTVCFEKCQQLSVSAKGTVPVSFSVPSVTPGPHEVEVSATSGTVVKKAVLTLVRLDPPRIEINDVSLPPVVNYGDSFSLKFTLTRASVSFPQNVSVEVEGGGASASIDVGELLVDQEIVVNIRSDQLYSSNPVFDIDVSFKDSFGKEFSVSKSASIQVNNVPWYKRVIGWFVDLF